MPRAKTNTQLVAELEELYRLGYRGRIDFMDDNLIGNKKAVKAFLPQLATWRERSRAHEGIERSLALAPQYSSMAVYANCCAL
jgi:hypothetical protein